MCFLQESEAWLLLLLELLAVVPPDQLLQQVLPLALSCGEVNEPVGSRVVCCRLLGAMAPHLVGSGRCCSACQNECICMFVSCCSAEARPEPFRDAQAC